MDEQLTPENPYASPNLAASEPIPAQVSWSEGGVTFSFQQTVEDYAAIDRFLAGGHKTSSVRSRPKLIITTVLLALVIFLVLIGSGQTATARPIVSWVMMGVFLTVLLGFIVLFVIVKFSGGFAKVASSSPGEWLSYIRVTIRPEGLETHTSDVDALRRWNSVGQAAETDDYFFLLRDQLIFLSVPKSIFADAEEARRVLELIRSYLPPPEQEA